MVKSILKRQENVWNEGLRVSQYLSEVLFFLDEEEFVGKGANTVISFVDTFFKYHGLGEKRVWLHADNCVGQNKNNILMWYLSQAGYSFIA